MAPPPTTIQQTNVVYRFTCPLPHSQAVEYVGMTQTTLSRRLTCHGQSGSILKHFEETHQCTPTREQFTKNTTIVTKESNRYKLATVNGFAGKISLLSNPLHNVHLAQRMNPLRYLRVVELALDFCNRAGRRSTLSSNTSGNSLTSFS